MGIVIDHRPNSSQYGDWRKNKVPFWNALTGLLHTKSWLHPVIHKAATRKASARGLYSVLATTRL